MTEMHAAHAGLPAGGGTAGTADALSIADILERRVALEWFEAVALVAGLCSTLAEAESAAMPLPRDVHLSPDGTMRVTGRGARKHDGAALPRLLHELLAASAPPTPLRLFVLHAISSESDRSSAAFGDALAYYERPGRVELIQSAYRRSLQTPVPEPEPAQPVALEEPAPRSEVADTPSRPSRRRGRIAAAAVVVCASVVVLAVAAGRRPVAGPDGGATLLDVVAATIAHTGSGIAQAITGGSTPVAEEAAETVASTAPPPAAPVSRKAARPRVVVRWGSSIANAIGAGAPAGNAAPRDEGIGIDLESADVGLVDAPELTAGAERSDDIVPPRLIDPVRYPVWAKPLENADTNVIELDVTASGTVERVRLLSPTTRMTDMMMLSAAKTWTFEPASKEGRPVPYRLTLNWVSPVP